MNNKEFFTKMAVIFGLGFGYLGAICELAIGFTQKDTESIFIGLGLLGLSISGTAIASHLSS